MHQSYVRRVRTPDEMSPAELYEAFATGGISRRAFIARLTAFGVTAAVAAAYANSASADDSLTSTTGSAVYPALYPSVYPDLYPSVYPPLYPSV
jgi:hypothetical protein